MDGRTSAPRAKGHDGYLHWWAIHCNLMYNVPHICLVITGVFLFAATTARSSNALLAWNCAYTLTSNVIYGVLYAVSPELFPTRDRGTGNAIVSAANHTTGVIVSLSQLSRSCSHALARDRRVGTSGSFVWESRDVCADLRRRCDVHRWGCSLVPAPI